MTFVVLIALVVFNLPSQTAAKFKLAIGSLFLPIFGLSASTQSAAEKAGNAVLPRTELMRQNEQLRRENTELRLRAATMDELARENAELRRNLAWQKTNPGKYKLARVIARDPSNWWRTIQINLGARDGIQANMPVRTIEGLIGKVSSVGATRSQVLLLGDPDLRVSALVQESRETGILFSRTASPLDNNMVDLTYLARMPAAKPGNVVVTSGDGGLFPRGIVIGQVVDLRPSENGLSTEARVKLAAKMTSLEEVWVMMP